MAHKESKKHQSEHGDAATKRSGETHSGTLNPDDQNNNRSTEHKSGYGGEGGEPRTSSDTKKE